jgi:fatty acid-binding protein DegV
MKTHIVTDSAARYSNTRIMQQFPITTVPNKIRIGQETYQEDVDIDVEELLSIMSSPSQSLAVEPPSIDDFASVYTRLSHVYDTLFRFIPHANYRKVGKMHVAQPPKYPVVLKSL